MLCLFSGCDLNNWKTVRGAATFHNAFFKDHDGQHDAVLMDSICKFLGGKKKASVPNSQPKDFFRLDIDGTEQIFSADSSMGGRPVALNGVTLYLSTMGTDDEEPVWKSAGHVAFPCDCGTCILVFAL